MVFSRRLRLPSITYFHDILFHDIADGFDFARHRFLYFAAAILCLISMPDAFLHRHRRLILLMSMFTIRCLRVILMTMGRASHDDADCFFLLDT